MVDFNELCFSAKKGDEKSSEEIIKRLNPLIISLANKFPYDDFDDMIQDGRVRVMECINEFDRDKGKEFLGYVNMQLRFFYRNRAKLRNYALSLNEKASDDDEEAEIIDFIKDERLLPEEILIKNMELKELKKAYEKLTDKQKKIIALHYFGGMSMAYIARDMGMHYQSVVKLKNRALKKLKSHVATNFKL